MKNLRELQARKAKHLQSMRAITDKAKAESRDLTTEEDALFAGEQTALSIISRQIEREETLIEAERSVGIFTREDTRVEGGEDLRMQNPTRGFRSFGEFAQSVRVASSRNSPIDERLTIGAAAPTTYGNEASGVDGGFLIPPQFSNDIFTLSLQDDALLPLCDGTKVSGNSMVFPKDETTPWGTDGVRAYWQAEATAGTQTKPKLGTQILRLHKIIALVPLTDELSADANALSSYLPGLMARSIRWKTNEAILKGTGVGQPMGVFTAACAVTQNKDSGQSANTISALNIGNMIARLPPGSYSNAVWLITPDALPSIFTLTLSNYPIYLSTNAGAQMNPYGMLMGRPIMPSQHVAAFSSTGDISLVDLSWYRIITKSDGIETAESMHLYFDADATAYRAIFRVDGQPKITAAISQAKGSNTLSPFVQLQNR